MPSTAPPGFSRELLGGDHEEARTLASIVIAAELVEEPGAVAEEVGERVAQPRAVGSGLEQTAPREIRTFAFVGKGPSEMVHSAWQLREALIHVPEDLQVGLCRRRSHELVDCER